MNPRARGVHMNADAKKAYRRMRRSTSDEQEAGADDGDNSPRTTRRRLKWGKARDAKEQHDNDGEAPNTGKKVRRRGSGKRSGAAKKESPRKGLRSKPKLDGDATLCGPSPPLEVDTKGVSFADRQSRSSKKLTGDRKLGPRENSSATAATAMGSSRWPSSMGIMSSAGSLADSPSVDTDTPTTVTLRPRLDYSTISPDHEDDGKDEEVHSEDDEEELALADLELMRAEVTHVQTAPRPVPTVQAAQHRTKEAEEDRMIRLATEMSLRSFKDQEQQRRSRERLMPSMSVSRNIQKQSNADDSELNLRSTLDRRSSRKLVTEEEARPPSPPSHPPPTAPLSEQLEYAREHLSKEEADEIEQALREAGEIDDAILPRGPKSSRVQAPQEQIPPRSAEPTAANSSRPPEFTLQSPEPSFSADQLLSASKISSQEAAQIKHALREAEKLEDSQSLMLALELQDQEVNMASSSGLRLPPAPQIGDSHSVGAHRSAGPPGRHPLEVEEERARSTSRGVGRSTEQSTGNVECDRSRSRDWGVGMQEHASNLDNISLPSAPVVSNVEKISLDDRDAVSLQSDRLDLEADEDIELIGGRAYNAFHRSVGRSLSVSTRSASSVVSNARSTSTRGTVDSDQIRVREDGMDPRERVQVNRAIRNQMIDKCGGVVKEGKRAFVYHANKGTESGGHDVAIKAIKRASEWGEQEENVTIMQQKQLKALAEREYSNLVRASQARVPVPSPLLQKENLIFMRFMGENHWPAPQIKEVDIGKGSPKWDLLYSQVMVAIRRLYVNSGLVHGNLSEDSILVAPTHLVENTEEVVGSQTPEGGKAVQACLIDFSESVDISHPSANELLETDLTRIKDFFSSMDIKTLEVEMAKEFVIAPEPDDSKSSSNDSSDESDVQSGESDDESSASSSSYDSDSGVDSSSEAPDLFESRPDLQSFPRRFADPVMAPVPTVVAGVTERIQDGYVGWKGDDDFDDESEGEDPLEFPSFSHPSDTFSMGSVDDWEGEDKEWEPVWEETVEVRRSC